MIDSRELRLGNLLIETEYDVRVVTVDKLPLEYEDERVPIPITEEWLARFGFEVIEQSMDRVLVQKILVDDVAFRFVLSGQMNASAITTIDKGNSLVTNEQNLLAGNAIIPNCPKHVHQLQNLFFALTGTELELVDWDQNYKK